MLPFDGVRVLELTTGIPGAYCGKMFADAGAEVVMLEPDGSAPLRRWRAFGPPGEGSALFGYLAAGKKSVGSVSELLAGADLVLVDGSNGFSLSSVPAAGPTVVVSVTPFGTRGPYVDADLRANEFILQALCGSIGSRGWPGERPFQAGGRIGEWVAGTYAAVAAAAALRRSRRTGRGDAVDVSILEGMIVTMGGLGAVSASVLGADQPMAGRTLELPSIVPTADGLVGFCTITAQQFADFLVLIDRPDLLEDRKLASFFGRVQRRDEFLEMVHSWAATRTTAEIVESAAAMRIPVAPIGTPGTVPEIDHFVERGVFVENAEGLLQPRVPYRGAGLDTLGPRPVPRPRADTVRWEPRVDAPPTGDPLARPLAGVRIADFTAFWAGPTATQTLAALGADVIKIEGLRRPDGMRFSGGRPPSWEQWWEWGSVFLTSNNDKRGLTLELSLPRARELALGVIATSDLVIENFSPRVMGNLDLGWEVIHATNPAAAMIRMPAFGLDGPWRDRVGFAQTMEQASGMAWMTGPADGPPVIPRGVCDPVAGLHAAFAALAALAVTERTGQGMQVESTMVEAALNVAAEAVLEAGAYGVQPHRDGNRGPGALVQGVYRCAGDDDWVALAVLDDEARRALVALAGGDQEAAIEAWTSGLTVDDAVGRLRAAGIAAARVNPAAALLEDEQLRARDFWEKVDHPVAGTFLATGMPFRFASVAGSWARNPAPTLGQHNSEILTGLLGLAPEELRELESAQVIGVRPAGL